MSSKSDIRKALKNNGYKIVELGRHTLYRDSNGFEVRIHNGDTFSDGQVRKMLNQIRNGSCKSKKRQGEAV